MFQEGKSMLITFFKKFHDKNMEIIALEKPFRVKTAKDVILSGKMDRVDKVGNKIEIIDYKTGKTPDEKKLKKDLQLSIYFLAATDKRTFVKSHEDIQKIKETLGNIIDNINKSDFTPKVGPWCNFCPYKMICEAWQ